MSNNVPLSPSALFDLSGRVALVSGGGTGIGLMIARGLGAAGAKVYIAGRRRDVLDKIVNSWDKTAHGTAVALTLDVTDKDSIRAARYYIEQAEGGRGLHILVNNAGQSGPVSPFLNDISAAEHASPDALGRALFDNEKAEDWDAVFRVNTASIFFTTTAFLGLLAAGSTPDWPSTVINITSVSGQLKIAQNHFAYNSSKAAASHISRMLSTEFALKRVNVHVNAISPGVYASEMTMAAVKSVQDVQSISQALVPVPAERAGTEAEIAGTVVYLASRAGSYTNGQEIVVDGGYLAVNPSTV